MLIKKEDRQFPIKRRSQKNEGGGEMCRWTRSEMQWQCLALIHLRLCVALFKTYATGKSNRLLCYLLHRLEQCLSIVLESHDQLQLGASRFHGWEETKWAVRSASKLNCLRHKHTCTNTWMHSKKPKKTKHAQLFCYLPLWKNVILHERIIELSHLLANFLDTVNAIVPVRSWVWPRAKSGLKSIC